ncbi:chitin synthase-domain-containing protein [Chytriomyces sp. MP71]|nr:chitin synthase-domain-containing protein [Chytriomyces sp. MP71]
MLPNLPNGITTGPAREEKLFNSKRVDDPVGSVGGYDVDSPKTRPNHPPPTFVKTSSNANLEYKARNASDSKNQNQPPQPQPQFQEPSKSRQSSNSSAISRSEQQRLPKYASATVDRLHSNTNLRKKDSDSSENNSTVSLDRKVPSNERPVQNPPSRLQKEAHPDDMDEDEASTPRPPQKNPSILRRGSTKKDVKFSERDLILGPQDEAEPSLSAVNHKARQQQQQFKPLKVKKSTQPDHSAIDVENSAESFHKPKSYPISARIDKDAPVYDASAMADFTKPQSRKASTTSIKQITMNGGKFVHEVAVSHLVNEGMKYDGSEVNGEEFTHLRYTAVTSDPDDFVKEGYVLRPAMFERKIKIAVVITMYNEDDILFCRSFRAIMKNIAYLCSGRALWNEESWKEVLVVIVSDGRAKVNPKVLDVLGILGIYMQGLIQDTVNDLPVKAHMFEFTAQASVDHTLKRRGVYDTNEGITLVPCQTIFLLKEKNAKKINSHRWFFNAVCESLQPNVCVLLDVGTKPTKESLFHLYNAFHYNNDVGGACGEVAADLGKYMINLVNPLVAVQNFEYKMSNILDKPLESVFGYISVLPGAFSAYRFEALKGVPLECYFKGETPHGENVAEANMYLAEDRILCFELVMKQDKSWLLKYVKSAKAETDVPTELDDLISQRRRWLNGSFFAAVYATTNWMRIFQSKHTTARKWILVVEFVYNAISLLFSWFNIGNFYLSFYFLFGTASGSSASSSTVDPFYPNGQVVFGVINEIYICCLITIFVLSLGNRPQGSKRLYMLVSALFAALMVLMLFMAFWSVRLSIVTFQSTSVSFTSYANSTPSFRDIIISMATVYGAYFISSLLFFDAGHCVTCIIQYMFLLPTYVNVFMVYAFCNIHDVSWGTKGDNKPEAINAVKPLTTADGKTVAMVEVPDDVDTLWEEVKERLDHQALLHSAKQGAPPPTVDKQTQHDDFFKQFRTRVVLLWVLSNMILVFVFTNSSILALIYPAYLLNSSVNPYLTFLFWSVTAMAVFRFIFSVIYICNWVDEDLRDSGKRRPFARFRRNLDKVAPTPEDPSQDKK